VGIILDHETAVALRHVQHSFYCLNCGSALADSLVSCARADVSCPLANRQALLVQSGYFRGRPQQFSRPGACKLFHEYWAIHTRFICVLPGDKTRGLVSAVEAQLRFPVLRGVASFLLVLAGGGLFLFSIPAAFGWDRGPISFGGAVIAILGLAAIFSGYWSVRNMEGGPVAAVCLKLALGFGSTFLLVGLIAAFLPGPDLTTPTGYFLAVGCGCVAVLVRFRAYTRDH